jgi:hypothetical protein
MRELFPTPLPEKIPILCPCPQVKRVSIALTPVAITFVIGALSSGLGGEFSTR